MTVRAEPKTIDGLTALVQDREELRALLEATIGAREIELAAARDHAFEAAALIIDCASDGSSLQQLAARIRALKGAK